MGLWCDGLRALEGRSTEDVLDKVGVKKEAIEIVFDGADGPVIAETPKFIKSIPVWKAVEDSTLIAYEMNGQPLPHFNGFPARIIVPGWTGTYWVKHVTSIKVVTSPETDLDELRIPNTSRKVPCRCAVHLARDGGQRTDH